ncbi:MAG: NifU family protein [Planctomycetes bacterium]|nr:NifU family protein [Planctomycetota bacterium]
MDNTQEEQEFRQRMQRIETLIQEVEASADPNLKAKTREIVQTLMEFHGRGLERMLEHIAGAGEGGDALFQAFARDGLIASLLLLYGLHPLDLETRVRQALDKVRPYLHSHQGEVELVSVTEGVVRLRLQGSCHGCPSSALTLKNTIEEAIYEAAPEVAALEVDNLEPSPAPSATTFIPVEQLYSPRPRS